MSVPDKVTGAPAFETLELQDPLPTAPASSPSQPSLLRLRIGSHSYDVKAPKHNPFHVQANYLRKINKLSTSESLNYEEYDSPRVRQLQDSITTSDKVLFGSIIILLGLVISCVAALLAVGLLKGSHAIQEYTREAYLSHSNDSLGFVWIKFFLFSLALGLSACFLTVFEPAIMGSGIPEVLGFLNGLVVPEYLGRSVFVLKPIGCLLAAGSGLYVGFEGPLMHIAALFAVFITTMALKVPRMQHLYSKFARAAPIFGSRSSHKSGVADDLMRVYVAAGAAVGMAAAFRSPLGGVAFVVEEATSFFRPTAVFYALFMTVISYWVVLALELGSNFNNPFVETRMFYFPTVCTQRVPLWSGFIVLVFGVLCGLLGHLVNTAVVNVDLLRRRYIWPRAWRMVCEVACLVLLTSTVTVFAVRFPTVGEPCDVTNAFSSQFSTVAPLCTLTGPSPDVGPQLRSCLNVSDWNQCISYDLQDDLTSNMTATFLIMYNLIDTPKVEEPNALPLGPNQSIGLFPPSIQQAYALEGVQEAIITLQSGKPDTYNQLRSLFWVIPEDALRNLLATGVYGLYTAPALVIYLLLWGFLAVISSGTAMPTGLLVPVMLIGAAFGRLCGVGLNAIGPFAFIDPGVLASLGAAGLWAGTLQTPFTVAIVFSEISNFQLMSTYLLMVVVVAAFVAKSLGSTLYHRQIHHANLPFLDFDPEPLLGVVDVCEIMSTNPVCLEKCASVERVRKALETTHNGFPLVDGEGMLCGLVRRHELQTVMDQAQGAGSDTVHISEFHHSPVCVGPTDRASHAFSIFRQLGLRYLIVVKSSRPVGIITRRNFMVGHDKNAKGHHDQKKSSDHTRTTSESTNEAVEETRSTNPLTHTTTHSTFSPLPEEKRTDPDLAGGPTDRPNGGC